MCHGPIPHHVAAWKFGKKPSNMRGSKHSRMPRAIVVGIVLLITSY